MSRSVNVFALPWEVLTRTSGPIPWDELERLAGALVDEFDTVWPTLGARLLGSALEYNEDEPLVEAYALAVMQLAVDGLNDDQKATVAHTLARAVNELAPVDGDYALDTIMHMSPSWMPWLGVEALALVEADDAEPEADVFLWGLVEQIASGRGDALTGRVLDACRDHMERWLSGEGIDPAPIEYVALAARPTGDGLCRQLVERGIERIGVAATPYDRVMVNEMRDALGQWGEPDDGTDRLSGAPHRWLPGWVKRIDEPDIAYEDAAFEPSIVTDGGALNGWRDRDRSPVADTIRNDSPKVGRNDPCPCGSGLKYKKCCGR